MRSTLSGSLTLFLLISQVVSAEPVPVSFVRASPQAQLKDQQLYKVTIKCERHGNLQQIRSNWAFTANTSAFHLVSFVNDQVGYSPVANAIAVIAPYSADSKGVYDHFATCNRTLFVSGAKPINIVATAGKQQSYGPGYVQKVIFPFAKILSPFVSLFSGGAIEKQLGGYLTNVGQIEAPIAAFQSAFNTTDPPATVSYPLMPGVTGVDTEYSRVVISVTPVRSIVQDRVLVAQFRASLSSSTSKLDPKNLEATCRAITAGMQYSGFAEQDISYALAYQSVSQGFDKEQTLTCLGSREYALQVVDRKELWTSHVRVSRGDIVNRIPSSSSADVLQPTANQGIRILSELIPAIGQFTRNAVVPPDASKIIAKLVAPQLTFVDATETNAIAAGSGSWDQMLLILKTMGVTRFGCYRPIEAETGAGENNMNVMFLAFHVPPNAKAATLTDGYVIKPFFEEGLITRLYFYRNMSWIKHATAKAGGFCGDLAVVGAN